MNHSSFNFKLKNKQKLYISPYSTLTKKLKIDLEYIGIKVSGIIDKNNPNAVKPTEIKNLDISEILIISPRYATDISNNLSKYISLNKLTILTVNDTVYEKKNIFLETFYYYINKIVSIYVKYIFKLFNIRFSVLLSARIGEFVLRNEKFIRKNRDEKQKYLLLCSSNEKDIANKTILKLYKRRFVKEKNTFFLQSSFLTKFFNQPFYDEFNYNLEQISNEYSLYMDDKTFIEFNSKEIEYGKSMLEKLNITTPYVCVFARDKNYLKANFKNDDYSHHDYRDCDIQTYNLAINYLIEKGFNVVRMGSNVLKKVNLKNENFFDYSFSNVKSDFMDIFLISQCEFMLGSTSGLVDVCNAFNIPRVGVNHMPIDHSPYATSRDLFIPKKLLHNDTYIGLIEYLKIMEKSGLNHWDADSYTKLNIIVEDNSPEEILYIVKEYLGHCSYNDIDKENQNLYQKIHLKSKQFREVKTNIGTDFLKKNRWFLQS